MRTFLARSAAQNSRVVAASYATLLHAEAEVVAVEAKAAAVEGTGTVLSVDSQSGHVLITPDDGSEPVCCPLWATDDWVALRPGTRVDFEVDQEAGLVLQHMLLGEGGGGGGEAVQVATAVRIRAGDEAVPLQLLLSQVETMLAQDENRRLKRELYDTLRQTPRPEGSEP
ncbi:hypothetical protein T492DRAFT_1084861 [Pavlovales sp. CCMP2436]|nr:hypothetical protein T492DRAFT_1084861 [Pavlovales sp. CCMP2436]